MNCNFCPGSCIRKGTFKTAQKYQCKLCRKYQRSKYRYRIYGPETESQIITLNNEGLGIRSIGRVLKIPKTSVQNLVFKIAARLNPPIADDRLQEYEVDEMHTYIGRNHFSCYTYIIYAINKSSRRIAGYVLGYRSKEDIGKLVNKLMLLSPKRIYTDKLATYAWLMPGLSLALSIELFNTGQTGSKAKI